MSDDAPAPERIWLWPDAADQLTDPPVTGEVEYVRAALCPPPPTPSDAGEEVDRGR